jgi:catechol 2,3-dioxygenase-like lactoylglutathione lyase family enzyme
LKNPGKTKLAGVTYLVKDYDEAIRWFVDVLGFELLEDTELSPAKRWVRVADRQGGCCLVLAKAEGKQQEQAVGKAAGGRVSFFLHTDNFSMRHAEMLQSAVVFLEQPRHETYGIVAVFEDLYGNRWDLIEPR